MSSGVQAGRPEIPRSVLFVTSGELIHAVAELEGRAPRWPRIQARLVARTQVYGR